MCQMCAIAPVTPPTCAYESTSYAVWTETTDAGPSTSTQYTMSVGDTFVGSIATSGDRDGVRIYLEAGQAYVINLQAQASGVGTLSDTYLRLYDATGALLREDDDSGIGLESLIRFTPTTSGYYYIEAAGYSASTGTYQMSVSAPAPIGSVGTLDQLATYLTNGYWVDRGTSPRSFDTSASNVITVNITALDAEGQQLARWAMDAWASVANLVFQETTEPAMIVFDDDDAGAYAGSSFSNGRIHDAWINVSTDWVSSYGSTIDAYTMSTYIHEIGHALGLGHQGNYNSSATYGVDNTFANDSWQVSIMSYFSQSENTTIDATYAYAATAMMADIVAIQTLYGASTVSNGNTVYGANHNLTGYLGLLWTAFSTGTPSATYAGRTMALTVYDSGGIDTIDVSFSNANQRLSLVDATYSDIAGYVGNLGIARGTIIENGTTGGGNDSIFGNAVANVLRAGAGNDTVRAGDGNDVVHGDDGRDRLFGEGGNDTLHGGNGADYLAGGNGRDRLNGGNGNDTIYGGNGIDTVIGGAGNDLIYGDAGNDDLTGSAGNDTIYGGAGNDVIRGGTEADWLFGGGGNDTLFGGAGHDTLNGGLGNDVLTGGGGRDVFVFNTALGPNNIDLITDFNVVEDTVALGAGVFAGLSLGVLEDSAFVANASGVATSASHRILYNTTTGAVLFDTDGDGGAAPVQFATLAAGLALTAADFLVIA